MENAFCFPPLLQAGSQLDQRLQIVTTMQKHMRPISVPPIHTWLDVQRKSRGCDQSHHLPNPSLTVVVELPEVEGEGERLLAVVVKGIDPISEEKEVASEGAVEARTEVALHLANSYTLQCPLRSWLRDRRASELTPSLHFALVSHAARKILATPPPSPGPYSCHRL